MRALENSHRPHIWQGLEAGAEAVTVVRAGALGDFILTLPAIDAIKFANPESPLYIIGPPRTADLARPDKVVDVGGADLVPLFVRGAQLPSTTTRIFAATGLCLAYTTDATGVVREQLERAIPGRVHTWNPQPDPRRRRHVSQHLLEPVRELGIAVPDPSPRLEVRAEDGSFAESIWRRERWRWREEAVVAVHPGSGGQRKCWPLERYRDLTRELTARGIRVLLLCGPADIDIARAFDQRLPPGAVLAEPRELWTLAGLLQRADLFIGNDSGPGHMAAAVGTPTISLFGPTDPVLWQPVGERCRVLRARNQSMDSLEVEEVLEAVLSELDGGSRKEEQ